MNFTTIGRLGLAAALAFGGTAATAAPVVLVKLTGTTGSAPAANTAVYRADLSVLTGTFAAIQIKDASGNFGGAGGRFSGFDLDAIKISATNCATAACAASAAGISLFNLMSASSSLPAHSARRRTRNCTAPDPAAIPSIMPSRRWACSMAYPMS